jgi:serine/threonine protein phosphatase 1
MEELLVIIGAELILLVSIVALKIHNRRANALAWRGPGGTKHADLDSRRTKQAAPAAHEKRRPRAVPARQQATENPLSRQRPAPPLVPARADAGDFANPLPENRAQYAGQPVSRGDERRGHRVSASLPHGIRIYAIGDIHGRSDLLSRLLGCIEVDLRERPVERAITVFVGDYIDRGPHSRNVIDLLLHWRESNDAVFLRGNHETFLPRFLSDSRTLEEWRKYGGLETLLSYGLQPSINPDRAEQERLAHQLASSLPKEHFHFLESLEPFYSCGDFFFVHAGIRPGIPIDEQAEEDLFWIREEFLAYEQPFECFIVHGHTPVEAIDFRSNRINIDTGAFATGCLTCVVIEGNDITQLPATVQVGAFSAP